jgi:addiction module HigA family antidote
MPMKNPPHPGRSIKDACLDSLKLSVTEGAARLGVARHTLSGLIHGHAGISPEMALRLEKIGWSSAESWLAMQTAHDLAQARKDINKIAVSPLDANTA